jgi:hypothetical protein
MKSFLFPIFLILGLFSNTSLLAQIEWEPMSGVTGSTDMSSLAVAPDGTWYILGDQVIYSSQDQGNSWICEREHGHLPKSRRMKFLDDGTPIWGDQNLMIIKRDGEWDRVGFSNDFETYKDTIYGISNGYIHKSWDKGLNWETHIFIPGTTIYRYRRHQDRHYIEYANSPNLKFGEVSLSGDILRSRFANSTGFKAFLIDDCHNIHYFYHSTHSIIYPNGTGEAIDLSLNDKISAVGDKIYRLTSGLQATQNCSNVWETISPATDVIDFYPINQDTFMFVYSDRISQVHLPSEEIASYPVKNADFYSWGNQEMPDGTIYLETNQGDFRILANGQVEELSHNNQFVSYGPNGWLYRTILNNGLGTDTLFVSSDRGVTWDKFLFPEGADQFSDMYPITNDIIAFPNIFGGTVLWFRSEDQTYKISEDEDAGFSHTYHDFKIVDNKIIMKGFDQIISYFDLNTKEFHTQIYTLDWEIGFSKLDNGGNYFSVNEDHSELKAIPYPYTQDQIVAIPEDNLSSPYGELMHFETTNEGCLLLYRWGLFYFDKNLVMSKVDLGPATGVQMNEIIQAESGRWILRTFGKQQTYISNSFSPVDNIGTIISGKIIGTDENCEVVNPISASNWKINAKNNEHNYFLFGQESGDFSGYILPGEYDLTIEPPSFTSWNECNWPEQITVLENMHYDSLDIHTQFTSACEAATISISSPFYRRCFETNVFVEINNLGQEILHSPVINLTPDMKLELISSSFNYQENGGMYSFNLDDINVGEKVRIPCLFLTNCSAAIGEELCISVDLELDNKCVELNYTDELCMGTIGSWDPNEKYVTDDKGSNKKYFQEDDFINFKIRFQNVGSDTAFNVRLEDKFDPNIDLMSLEILSASHDYKFTLNEQREMVVLFENIKLVDSTANEVASHGFFEYRIKASPSFTESDSIVNSAGIYFDFNEAVVTNEVIAILEPVSSTKEAHLYEPFVIWPNPAKDYIQIDLSNSTKPASITVFNLEGRHLIKNSNYYSKSKIPVSNLSDGIYFIKIESEIISQVLSFVKS